MDADDKLTSDILAALACMPFERQAEAMRDSVSTGLKHLSTQRLCEIRRRIELEMDETNPAVRTTMELIDGQLALREIAGGAFWR
ncbi:hypothetical protein [Opitutus sp. ER46]|uniref:hypothetical protein n=1 Tax=Opitutus sp. ER46 TaxID=2161864 RepID=UPI000D2F5F6A|nr:hypothetical protein [Opitutus sp. ER46]PTX94399.1 hypothetical protein DB354_11650 [Opitutus sp. ER46]